MSSQTTPPAQVPTPTIDRLLRVLERATKLLQTRGVDRRSQGLWAAWVRTARNELGSIYGYRDSVRDFGLIPNDLSDAQLSAILMDRIDHLRRFIENLDGSLESTKTPLLGKRIFIGHGRSPLWRELKDLIFERLGLLGTSSIGSRLQVLQLPNDSKLCSSRPVSLFS